MSSFSLLLMPLPHGHITSPPHGVQQCKHPANTAAGTAGIWGRRARWVHISTEYLAVCSYLVCILSSCCMRTCDRWCCPNINCACHQLKPAEKPASWLYREHSSPNSHVEWLNHPPPVEGCNLRQRGNAVAKGLERRVGGQDVAWHTCWRCGHSSGVRVCVNHVSRLPGVCSTAVGMRLRWLLPNSHVSTRHWAPTPEALASTCSHAALRPKKLSHVDCRATCPKWLIQWSTAGQLKPRSC